MNQLDLFQNGEVIETVCIQPTKDMPLEFFKVCHHLAYFIELMERIDDGHVVWDEEVTSIYSENLAAAEYQGIQNGWFSVTMELPKKFIEGGE